MARKKEVVPVCAKHQEPMVKVQGQYYCKKCVYGSFLTDQAQKSSVKRYRESDAGKKSEKEYEQSEKGQVARGRYFHSEKYKAARRAYNQRLKESLSIARAAHIGAGQAKPEELRVTLGLEGLMAEIREYIDQYLKPPTVANVIATAKRDYNQIIDEKRAKELIESAYRRRK